MRDERHSRGELLEELLVIYLDTGRIPTPRDVEKYHQNGLCACYETYRRRFGGFGNAIKELRILAGLEQLELKI